MPVTIRFDKRASMLALASLVLMHTTSLSAASPVLLLGEIRVLSHKAASDSETFRSLVQKRFRTLVVPDRRDRKSYILSATLTEFRTVERGDSHTTTCVVTTTLRDRAAGVIRATTSGSVKILESDRPTPSDDLAAMQTAVERALARVPEALF
jgi:hypothetical protein